VPDYPPCQADREKRKKEMETKEVRNVASEAEHKLGKERSFRRSGAVD
jgi:hypothetical protein